MSALPKATDDTRGLDVFDVAFIDPIERLTHALRRGTKVSEADVVKLERLIRRTEGLKAALEHRQGLAEKVLEDDDA